MNPFQVVHDFEDALCLYSGARFAVTVTSCTMALLLAVRWCLHSRVSLEIEIPRFTYIGVGMSILHAGGRPIFRDEDWVGEYELKPLAVFDCARWLRADMYKTGTMACLSFHPAKHLGISTHGGAILHDSRDADAWLRRSRFDGRAEGVEPRADTFNVRGFHCYMAPPTAAEGLEKLSRLPEHNEPLPNSAYSDLSLAPVFR